MVHFDGIEFPNEQMLAAYQSACELPSGSRPNPEQFDAMRYAERERRDQSFEDALTGLLNLRGLERQLKDGIRQRAEHQRKRDKRRSQGGDIAVVCADLDDFKSHNDRYGHKAGDDALKDAAYALLKAFREYDIVARTGGDEFTALLLGSQPSDFSHRLHEAAERYEQKTRTAGYPGTMSLGVARWKNGMAVQDMREFEAARHRADEAAYKAKKQFKSGEVPTHVSIWNTGTPPMGLSVADTRSLTASPQRSPLSRYFGGISEVLRGLLDRNPAPGNR